MSLSSIFGISSLPESFTVFCPLCFCAIFEHNDMRGLGKNFLERTLSMCCQIRESKPSLDLDINLRLINL